MTMPRSEASYRRPAVISGPLFMSTGRCLPRPKGRSDSFRRRTCYSVPPSNFRTRSLAVTPAGPPFIDGCTHSCTLLNRIRCSIGLRNTVTQNSVIGPGVSVMISPWRNSATQWPQPHTKIQPRPRRHDPNPLGPDTRRGNARYPCGDYIVRVRLLCAIQETEFSLLSNSLFVGASS